LNIDAFNGSTWRFVASKPRVAVVAPTAGFCKLVKLQTLCERA